MVAGRVVRVEDQQHRRQHEAAAGADERAERADAEPSGEQEDRGAGREGHAVLRAHAGGQLPIVAICAWSAATIRGASGENRSSAAKCCPPVIA